MESNILQGDCREHLPNLQDESIDCIITDPPYSGLQSKSRGDGRFSQDEHHIEYDDMSERAFLLFVITLPFLLNIASMIEVFLNIHNLDI